MERANHKFSRTVMGAGTQAKARNEAQAQCSRGGVAMFGAKAGGKRAQFRSSSSGPSPALLLPHPAPRHPRVLHPASPWRSAASPTSMRAAALLSRGPRFHGSSHPGAPRVPSRRRPASRAAAASAPARPTSPRASSPRHSRAGGCSCRPPR